jgi:predicted ferric reductase
VAGIVALSTFAAGAVALTAGGSGSGPATLAIERLLLAAVYGSVLCAPLAVIAGVAKPGAQGPLVVLADLLGFVALSLLALQLIVSGRWAGTTRSFGLRPVLSLHRKAGVAVLVLVVMHVAILVLDDPARLALLDPGTAPGRARAGMLATLGLVALALTSICRKHLRLSYERWRGAHLACTALVLAAAFVHIIWLNAYTSVPLVRWGVLTLVLAAATALFWTRIARPYATALRPYRVVAVKKERGDAGIGITPALSVLRTAAERDDRRRHLLLYGSRRWADVTFREELGELERELPNLRVAYVLSRPEPGWRGDRGRLGEDLLRRYAPRDVARWSALICGPAAMVADASCALERLGVPRGAIQAEGFG